MDPTSLHTQKSVPNGPSGSLNICRALEVSAGGHIHQHGLRNTFLNKSPEAQALKEKIDKFRGIDFIRQHE
jgi:hypothetical protein